MTDILSIFLVIAVVLMVIGFGCGWYVRGAYVRRYMKERLKAGREQACDAIERRSSEKG